MPGSKKQNRSIDQLTLKHFLEVGLIYKKQFYLSFFIALNTFCLYTLGPLIVGRVLAALTHPAAPIRGYIIAFIIVAIAGYLSNRIGFVALLSWQPKVMAKLQEQALDTLFKRGMSFHNDHVSGKLVSDTSDYPSAFSQLSNTIFTNIMPFAVSVITGIIVVTISSPLLGLLMTIMSFLAIGSGVMQRRKMRPFRQARIKAGKDTIAHFADAIVNIQTVKSFAKENAEMATHNKLGKTLYERRAHDWGLIATDGSLRIAIMLFFELLFLILVTWLVHRDPSVLSTGIFAFSYTINLANRLFEVGTIMRSIEEAFLLAEPTTTAMQETPEILDAPGAPVLNVPHGAIAFENVDFHYNDSSKHDKVFSGLSLQIKPGEKIGLVGPSGGGKTTITKLLLRFEDIQGGTISIDGQDISQVTQVSLRENIAYVPQESLLFHRSVHENISYGKPGASLEAVHAAAHEAYADEFIAGLPQGYDTVVGERGVKLSGGQRQRIAIARAILKDAPILLLDEATSALDSESEVVIQKALWKLMQHRTAIVIAHRLSTIQKMDRIVVLNDGKIIEQGSHADLLKNDGLYARLWAHQSGGFIEE